MITTALVTLLVLGVMQVEHTTTNPREKVFAVLFGAWNIFLAVYSLIAYLR